MSSQDGGHSPNDQQKHSSVSRLAFTRHAPLLFSHIQQCAVVNPCRSGLDPGSLSFFEAREDASAVGVVGGVSFDCELFPCANFKFRPLRVRAGVGARA
jgi:hypothetical protein